MVFVWLLTDWFGRAFDGTVWPLLGFLLMPYTTLAYMAAMLKGDGSLSGGWLLLVVVAVVVDVAHCGKGGKEVRRRRS